MVLPSQQHVAPCRKGVEWEEGNGATQSATCCSMQKRGWVGIERERFGDGGSVLGQHLDRGYTGSR